jgi:hypothetical protein
MQLRRALGDEAGLAEYLEGIADGALATGAAVTLLSASSSLRTRHWRHGPATRSARPSRK